MWQQQTNRVDIPHLLRLLILGSLLCLLSLLPTIRFLPILLLLVLDLPLLSLLRRELRGDQATRVLLGIETH